MTDRTLLPDQTNAPAGAPVPITENNRSDANDGVDRPLGFYSSQAQADRNAGNSGETPSDEAAGGPGFFSPEQQAARNAAPKNAGKG
jgi:hypothetical protein